MRGDPRIEIGGVARAHGIRGEVVIVTHDPDSRTLADVDRIWVGGVERRITGARSTPRGWLVLLDGTATRSDAEALRGQPVEVDRAALELADDDILLADLVGCAVVLPDGRPWGTVAAVEIGLQDRLVIHDGEVERMLPLVDELVRAIDLVAGVITIDPPDGLPETPRSKLGPPASRVRPGVPETPRSKVGPSRSEDRDLPASRVHHGAPEADRSRRGKP